MAPEEIEALFTQPDGRYRCARWGRPLAPVVFGVEDATLAVIKGAFEAMSLLAGQPMARSDPETGSNCTVIFLRDWRELADVAELARRLPGLEALAGRLAAGTANQYRALQFDEAGAIRAGFVFLRMDRALAAQPAEELALTQVAQIMLTWSAQAFATRSPLALDGGRAILRPEIAALIRVAYDPGLPVSAEDASHALRLYARMEAAA